MIESVWHSCLMIDVGLGCLRELAHSTRLPVLRLRRLAAVPALQLQPTPQSASRVTRRICMRCLGRSGPCLESRSTLVWI